MRSIILSAVILSCHGFGKSQVSAFQIVRKPAQNHLKSISTITTRLHDSPITDIESSQRISWISRKNCWRPTVSDVERISWGKPAKKKGTGSRGVPHRLNHEEERYLFDQARRKGFLEVPGSGWRSERRDAPLVNSYRSLCDARGQVCIILHKLNTGMDDIVLDLSPLRLPSTYSHLEKEILEFIDLPSTYAPSGEDPVDLVVNDLMDEEVEIDPSDDPWNCRPIYQLPTYSISWRLDRAQAKDICKKLAVEFKTSEESVSNSKKPNHVKPGKNRRHGGYGIG